MTTIGEPRREETRYPQVLPYPHAPGTTTPDVAIPDRLPDTVTNPTPAEPVPA